MDADRIIPVLDTLTLADLRRVHQRAGELLALVEGWQQDEPSTGPSAGGDHYRQEYTKCNKAGCTTCTAGQGHGPYWYRYYREQGKLKKQYLGKNYRKG